MATKLLTALALTTGVISAPAALTNLQNVVFGDSYSDEARHVYIDTDSPFSGGRIWGRVVAKNTVYTLWIGTNDLGQDGLLGREASDSKKKNTVDPTSTVDDYLKCVWDAIDQSYNAGARNFVLFKLDQGRKLSRSNCYHLRCLFARFGCYRFAQRFSAYPGARAVQDLQRNRLSEGQRPPVELLVVSYIKSSAPLNDALHLSPAAERLIAREFQLAIKGVSKYAKSYASSA
ncbi:GDSL lipase/acylhydrolase family protein [Metarhizium acridum CQMa 102]|uniref:GDSL lipase/acylhydrolase family protein n=1 Tax=Metarhizium acridum (strain CQMa 102) TaxID=655827 RepID=E9E7D4_METAQ|nr:GDSL lipase/acylhydrolase family protein [Metarhizium acridum CQMa 102]EFY88176.1 GDSL lipase/acylhydrolase family protein [Metarhizium acridum CQMa 102]